MTKEEMKNKCTERAKIFQQAMESCHSSSPMDCIEWFADRIAELEKELQWERDIKTELAEHLGKANDKVVDLEKKISVLLFCKNCPDNKGGYICQKEYEDKCLAQKIQYIKELKEENRQLKDEVEDLSSYCNQIGKVKTEVLKAFEHIVAK